MVQYYARSKLGSFLLLDLSIEVLEFKECLEGQSENFFNLSTELLVPVSGEKFLTIDDFIAAVDVSKQAYDADENIENAKAYIESLEDLVPELMRAWIQAETGMDETITTH